MEISQIAQGKLIPLNFEEHKDVKLLLITLHNYYDLSWTAIADLPAINPPGARPIPFSTLAKISKTGKVPEKWRARFNLGAIDNRPRTMIHLQDMRSAANTLYNHVSLEDRIDLIGRLREGIINELRNGSKSP